MDDDVSSIIRQALTRGTAMDTAGIATRRTTCACAWTESVPSGFTTGWWQGLSLVNFSAQL